MLLSNIFKRFPQKQPAREHTVSSLSDHSRRAREAALELLSLLKAKFIASDGSLHAGTMLSAAAWLTGTSLYRSFGFRDDSAPGTFIKSGEVNTTWEGLIRLLELYSFRRSDIPVGRLMMAATAAPDFLDPEVDMLYVQNELQDQYNAVMKRHGFGYLDGARVGLILCSNLIQQYYTAQIIDCEVATGLVAEKILEAAKTIPPPLIH